MGLSQVNDIKVESEAIPEARVARVLAHLLRNEDVSSDAIERAVASAQSMRLGESTTLLSDEMAAYRRAFVYEQLKCLKPMTKKIIRLLLWQELIVLHVSLAAMARLASQTSSCSCLADDVGVVCYQVISGYPPGELDYWFDGAPPFLFDLYRASRQGQGH